MGSTPPWEAFLAEHLLGYLLPEAAGRALSREAAARFLSAISGQERQLFILRATSVLSPRVNALSDFALRELPLFARGLLSRTEVERRAWEGRALGKLDVPATLRERMRGQPTQFVGRSRRRSPPRPEDVLVKAVTLRLVSVLGELRRLGALHDTGFSAALPSCERALSHLLATTALSRVEDEPVTSRHEAAARAARHPVYAISLDFYRALTEGLDSADPEVLAKIVAEGALAPLSASTRFELAVLVRLLEALSEELTRRAPSRFRLLRTLIAPGRRDIAVFEREDGATIQIFYNQACLSPGPYDLGVRRYLGQRGRLRPDITLIIRAPGAPMRAAVIEAKLSSDPSYLAQGYQEALLYRAEYEASLTGWPKAILVASEEAIAPPRLEDDVVAVGWEQWVPDVIVKGLLEGV